MRFDTTVLAVMVMASTATAAPEPEAAGGAAWPSGVVGAYKMKRAAYDINDILKRHAEAKAVCEEPDSLCEEQRRKLDNIAEAAMDGYDEVSKREAVASAANKLPWSSFCGMSGSAPCKKNGNPEALKHLVKHCDEPGSHCLPKRSAEPASRVAKRSCSLCAKDVACPPWIKEDCIDMAQQAWYVNSVVKRDAPGDAKSGNHLAKRHCALCPSSGPCPLWMLKACWKMAHEAKPQPKTIHVTGLNSGALNPLPATSFCGMPHGGLCFKKRNAPGADVAARPFRDTIHAIRDAVQQVKRDVEAEKVEDDADDFYAEVLPYFQDLEARVDDAVASTKL